LGRIRRILLTTAVIILLSFSFLQYLPVVTARAINPDARLGKPPPTFSLKGPAPDSLPILASIAIPLRNVDRLTSMVAQVSDPASPNFRHFLTDQQVTQYFLPTARFNEMMQYLSGTGLRVLFTELDSMIVVSGTVAQLKEHLGANLNVYSNGTVSYYVASTPPFKGALVYASNVTGIFAKPALLSGYNRANVTFTRGDFSAKRLQAVYNATSLYAQGIDGKGKRVGLLDFYGSPTIESDLKLFDKIFGFPDPTFNIIPIGPYDPNLGVSLGWSTEISLDVESAHAMAPGATVDLYVANGALSLADAVSKIVKDGKVNSLSQSFTIPEWVYSFFGPSVFEFNALIPDQLYMLGALKGITFTGATGDTGGAGFTSGIEGQLGYPASSPFVTAVGGTQTYFAGDSFVQTAWSNIGFVPNGVNFGGTTGGVSILEPQPWYQSGQQTPRSLPLGRMNPDLALQGGPYPATYIVDAGSLVGEGGTSESSPLFAGLVTLIDQYAGGSAGLINPFLYYLGNSASTYAKAYAPITFGYIVPWVASNGYNLVTGFGAPNIGEMASLYKGVISHPSLNVTLSLSPGADTSGLEYMPGTSVAIRASITNGGSVVKAGSFTATLSTLTSQQKIGMTFDATKSAWVGRIGTTNQNGMAFVTVQGSSGNLSGTGFAVRFLGYMGTFVTPVVTDPWSFIGGLTVIIQSTDLDGNFPPRESIQMGLDSYSILKNTYARVDTVALRPSFRAFLGPDNEATLSKSYPDGPMTFVLLGDNYGYLPFVNGIYLQTTYIYPEVAAEPGSVAAGQKLTIVANPVAPFNLYFATSYETGGTFGGDLSVGANVTARLVAPGGPVISTGRLAFQSCQEALRVCRGGASNLNGYLEVPTSAHSGLYTIILTANYSSTTIGKTVNGTFFSQVWVSGAALKPTVSLMPGAASATRQELANVAQGAQPLYQGQSAHVEARITYPNGSAVRYGVYTALIYPQSLANDFTTIMHMEYVSRKLIQLVYNPALGAWVGNLTLPSSYDPGALAPVNNNSFYYSGPYAAYVTGVSADGMPTTTALSAQLPFYIQPYVYMTGQFVGLPQTSGLVFSSATVKGPVDLAGDLFSGSNTVSGGTVTITSSQVQGTLTIVNARVTLTGVSGGDISVVNGSITLRDSSVGKLSLTGSNVSLSNSSYQTVAPTAASIAFGQTPTQPASGQFQVTASVAGLLLSAQGVAMWVDGTTVQPVVSATPSGLTAVANLDASSMADGVHLVTVTVTQTDGIVSSASSYVTTNSHIAGLDAQLQRANAIINDLSNRLKDTVAQLGNVLNFSYGLAVLAVVGLAIAVMAYRRNLKPSPR